MGLESLCGYVEIERAHRTLTYLSGIQQEAPETNSRGAPTLHRQNENPF